MSLSRLTLPSAFIDKLSDEVLLPPEPGYLWGDLIYAAAAEAQMSQISSLLAASRTFTGAGINTPDSMAGPADLNLDKIRAEAVHVERFAVGQGTTVMMNRTVFSDTTYTEASRRITRSTIGTTAVDLTGEQVRITIERYGGPYGASAVGPHVIESFDLQRSHDDLIKKVGAHLRRDRTKFLDSVVGTKMCTSALTTQYVYPGDLTNAITADNTAFLAQGDRPMDLETFYRAEQVAKDKKIPSFANGRYMAVISPQQERQLRTSMKFLQAAQYSEAKNPLFARYFGTLGMTDIFVSQTNPTATANSTITVQQGVLFGPGSFGYAIAKGCTVEPDDATNFGQRVMVIWAADEGFQILDNRFLVSIRSD